MWVLFFSSLRSMKCWSNLTNFLIITVKNESWSELTNFLVIRGTKWRRDPAVMQSDCYVAPLLAWRLAFSDFRWIYEFIGYDGISRRVNFKTLLQYEGKIGFKDNDKVKKSVKYYYLKKFKENEKDILFSWNWSAALVPFWALYRKMYIIWFVFFIIFSRIGVAIVCHFFPLLPMETVCFYIWILSCLFWGILLILVYGFIIYCTCQMFLFAR